MMYELTEAGMATTFGTNGEVVLPEMVGQDAQPTI
jgi:hypothetical protein